MSNISQDLKEQDAKACFLLLSSLFNTPFRALTLGDPTPNTCVLHQSRLRAYAINGFWHFDFCYPCFSQARATGLKKKGGGKGFESRTHKSHWAQG